MKPYLIFFILFAITACEQPVKKATVVPPDNPDSLSCDTTIWYAQAADRDSVLVYDDNGDKGYYKKGELKRILASYPELNEEYLSPDNAFAKQGKDGKAKPCEAHHWNCEVCQDEYYILYAYFLKQRNGEKQYQKERQKLIDIYRDLNSIFGKLSNGGTYFGHQYRRIPAYAEYAISLNKSDPSDNYYHKPYNINNQKNLYIAGLKQYITDELNNTYEIAQKDKPTLKKELFETVNQINGLIDSYFYLKMAQEFQHSNY